MGTNDYRHSEDRGPTKRSDVEAAIAAGAAIGTPRAPISAENPESSAVYAVIPKDYELKSLEELLPRPLRIKQEVALEDTDSFTKYVNDFKTGDSRIFFGVEEEAFVAVLDYHGALPAWCEHLASFKPRRSLEFQAWMGANRKQMTQVDFARFVEENLPDIKEPPSAELLQVALTFEAKKSVEFSSGVRLANGQIEFQYDEIVRGSAQKGKMEAPEKFLLGIPIHVNGPAYAIEARLRWRLQEGKLAFWYELVRPHKYIEDALKEIRGKVTKDTEIAVLSGSVTE